MVKYGVMGRVLLVVIDFLNGVISGIPPCCSLCYAAKSGTCFQGDEFGEKHVHTFADAMAYKDYDYVPCPNCFRKRRKYRLLNTPVIPTRWLYKRKTLDAYLSSLFFD